MKIFYLCHTGHHTSLLAAALHTGMIAENQKNPWRLRGFDDIKSGDIGTPYYVGTDGNDAEIYTIGVWNENMVMSRTLNDLINLMEIPRGQWKIVDTTSHASRWTIFGHSLKRLGFDSLAKMFFKAGVRKELKGLAAMVKKPDKSGLHH